MRGPIACVWSYSVSCHCYLWFDLNSTDQLADILARCLNHRVSAETGGIDGECNSAAANNGEEYLWLTGQSILSTFAAAQHFGASNTQDVEAYANKIQNVSICGEIFMLIYEWLTIFCSAYNKLMSAIRDDPDLGERLCINGPYDTEIWRLTSTPAEINGVSNELFNSFITVCT